MKKSRFNLSETHLTTAEMGKLIPIYHREMLPNDTFILSLRSIHKMQPLVAPLMHQINVMAQWYFVPYRLLWEDWTQFITGGDDGTATPVFPTIKAPADGGAKINTLHDYIGMPTEKPNVEISALPYRAYAKIWNDHYKIDDIQEEKEISYMSGVDSTTPTQLIPCNWARDRFTKAKPFTQRGAQIAVPVIKTTGNNSYYAQYKPTFKIGTLTQTKPTTQQLGTITAFTNGEWSIGYRNSSTTFEAIPSVNEGFIEIILSNEAQWISTQKYTDKASPQTYYVPVTEIVWGEPISYSNSPDLREGKLDADFDVNRGPATGGLNYRVWWGTIKVLRGITLTVNVKTVNTGTSEGINIRDLRIASAIQRFQEKSLKYGAEYEDYCKQEFGIAPRDSRLQKSEYLGGSSSIIQISEIFQQTDTTDTPLGAEAGHGIGGLRQRRIKYRAPEHGIIMCLLSYRPTTLYTQGIKRELLRRNRFDFFTRELQDIGAEEILQQELFANENNKDTVFGYDLQGNYRDYKTAYNRVSGNFKTDMSFWHLGRMFQGAPVLNNSFCEMQVRKDILAITDQTLPAFMVFANIGLIAYRPMPKKSRNILK